MQPVTYTLFETKLGTCGIAWRESNLSKHPPLVVSFQLPEATDEETETRIVERWPARKSNAIPPEIKKLVKNVQRHFMGKSQQFNDVDLALDGVGRFAKQIYEIARTIPPGTTVSYGQLAEVSGHPGAARAVGHAMSRNPIPLFIPCHRVLTSGGKLGGFSAHGGVATKTKMLEIEGVTIGRPVVIRSAKDIKRAASQLAQKDPQLTALLSCPIDFQLQREASPYETLVKAVVHQQLSPTAAAAILGRIEALYPTGRIPAPIDLQKTRDSELRTAGLSHSKIRALKDIAAKTLDGTVPTAREITALSDTEIIRRLTSIFGVGKWTVEMMLIFNLGRMDILPVDDYALRKSITAFLGKNDLLTPKELDQLGAQWQPYRTIASLYFWKAKSDVIGVG